MRYCATILFLSNALLSVTPVEGAKESPNVLVIVTDDQGWGDLSCHGNTNLSTPHVDGLAAEGVSFERFYVQPVCSPTRAELLTGLYHPRLGVAGVSRGMERMDSGVQTVADVFRQAGYATAAFGKWHNGTQAPYHPMCRGFDQFYGFCSGHWGHYFSPMLDNNGRIKEGRGYVIDDFTSQTIKFIEKNRDTPFFALVAYNSPHSPMQVPDNWWNRHQGQKLDLLGTNFQRENQEHTRAALAMCENIDWNVGRLLNALTERNLEKQTVVVYLSDNGPNGHRWNGGMRGIKGSTDEGGVRSPLLIRWAGRLPAGHRVRQNAAVIDLLPTLCELAKIDAPEGDGKSLQPLLGLSEEVEWPERRLFSHWSGRVAVRQGSLMLDRMGRLYDLEDDPNQETDISQQRPEVAKRMRDSVERWRRDVLGTRSTMRPIVIGDPALEVTQMPARDADSFGGIKRSSRHPNSSYFSNWKSAEDSIHWDVKVAEPGQFLATIYYACEDGNEGSLVELRLGENSIRGRVSPSNPSPTVGQDQDRVPRQESYEKNWRTLELGVIELPQIEGQLSLKAIDLSADEIMEFRLLTLERLNRKSQQ